MYQDKNKSIIKSIDKIVDLIEKHKHRDCFAASGILIFTFYAFTQRWFALYLEVRAYQIIIVCLALLLLFLGVYSKKNYKNMPTTIDVVWFIAISVILTNILLVEHDSRYMDLFLFSAVFLFLLLAKVNIQSYIPSFIFIAGSSMIYAIGSITQYLYTESFNKFIFNYTTQYSQESIIDLNRRRYFPGLGFGKTAVAPGYMAAGFGLLLSFWDSNKNIIKKIVVVSVLILLLIGLIVAAKRSIFLWVLVAMPVTYFALGAGAEKWKRALQTAGVTMILLMLLLLILQMPELPPFLQRMKELFSRLLSGDVFSFIGFRLVHYEDAWRRFLEEPIFGIGWKQFEILHEHQTHVHNFNLQLLTEIGIVGFLLVKTAFIYTFIKTYLTLQALQLENNDAEVYWKYGLTFSFYYQVFFLLFGIFGNPFNEETFIMIYFIAISITNSYLLLYNKNLMIKANNK